MGLLNFDLKLPDFSNLGSIKEAVSSKVESLGLNNVVEKVGGAISGNNLVSGLSDSVIGSIQDSIPDMDSMMDGVMDFDMESMMGGFSVDSMTADIDSMVNGIDLNIDY